MDYPEIPRRNDARDDANLFRQTAGKISTVTFPDYRKAYDGVDLPNVKVFRDQMDLLIQFLIKATPDEAQRKNIDYILALGEMFTLVVYAQLILKNLRHYTVADVVVNQIFNFLVREFSQFALYQLSNYVNSDDQKKCRQLILMKTPVIDPAQEEEMWNNHVSPLIGTYTMNQ